MHAAASDTDKKICRQYMRDGYCWWGGACKFQHPGEEDEQFYERMYLLEELEDIILELYQEFLAIRLDLGWNKSAQGVSDNHSSGTGTS